MSQVHLRQLLHIFRSQDALFIVFLLILLLSLMAGLGGFPYPSSQAEYSDFTISHYPNAVFLQRAISRAEFPLWSSSILSGYPFFASPLSGLWYPIGWLALAFPLPLGLNLLAFLHLLSGGVGQYLLVREQRISPLAAALAGIAFAGMPKIVAHFGAGHLTLLYAVSWTPWLLFFSGRKTRSANWVTPIILALVTLSDARWLPYAVGGWWWYEMVVLHGGRVTSGLIKRLATQTATGLLLAAPLLIPLAEYARLSSRSAMKASDVLEYSLPWDRLLGLVFPSPGGFHEWMLYPGAAVLVLGLCAPWAAPNRSALANIRGWGGLVILCWIWSLGEHFPGLNQLARLPGLSWLRVPPRALFLAGMGLAMMAAYALQGMLQGGPEPQRHRLRLSLVAILSITVGIGVGAQLVAGKILIPFLWGALGAGFACLLVLFIVHRQTDAPVWVVLLLLATLLDLGLFGKTLVSWRSPSQVLSESEELARAILGHSQQVRPGVFRIYSPSYSMPQQTAVQFQFELADGVEPLQWQPYVTFMEEATGIPSAGYSVTLPAFANGQPARDNQSYLPDAVRLGLLNVRYVASEFDLQVEGLISVGTFGGTRLYENQYALPRAWVQREANEHTAEIQPAEVVAYRANRVDVRAAGPGRLVLAEMAYPGWQVWVDGKAESLLTQLGVLRAVELSEGDHIVSFVFRPPSLMLGLGLFFIGLALSAFSNLHDREPHL